MSEGNRFKQLRESRSLTQAQLAKALGCSQATLSRWEKGEATPSYEVIKKLIELYGFGILKNLFEHYDQAHIEFVSNQQPLRLEWQKNTLWGLDTALQNDIDQAIRFFEDIVCDKLTRDQAIERISRDRYKAYDALGIAFKLGALKLTHVPRDAYLENQLMAWSQGTLKKVIVAAPPHRHDCTPIRVEYVAWLAAKYALPPLANKKHIGVGAGYTIRRFAELSKSSVGAYESTTWLPLTSYKEEFDKLPPRSSTANYAASYLVTKHPGSKALLFPFMEVTNTARHYLEAKIKHYDLNAAFFSVNGYGRAKHIDENIDKTIQFLSSNLSDLGTLRAIYLSLEEDMLLERVAGALFGYLIDHEGKHMAQIDEKIKAFVDTVDLDILKAKVEKSQRGIDGSEFWIVAARKYKADAVRATLLAGLANCMVIDAGIADKLLSSPLSIAGKTSV